MKEAVRILGIDPGTRYFGYGVIERLPTGRVRYIECGVLEPKRTAEDRWPYNPSGYPEVHITSVTVRLTDRELKMLKARTGEKDASAAVKARITRANPRRSTAQLRAALRQSLKQETAGKGRRFRSGGEPMRWLES